MLSTTSVNSQALETKARKGICPRYRWFSKIISQFELKWSLYFVSKTWLNSLESLLANACNLPVIKHHLFGVGLLKTYTALPCECEMLRLVSEGDVKQPSLGTAR